MPEKTRPYDPELDGDGFSKMVPMHVEPPKGRAVFIYRNNLPRLWIDEEGICSDGGRKADGWTFRPSTPEPEKSYAGYLDIATGEAFIWNNGMIGEALVYFEQNSVRSQPKRARALIDFIQDTLAEQEAGE